MKFLSWLSAFPITPMDRDGQIDAEALRKLIARLCVAEVDSIGLLGSTGTYMYLSREERRRALALALAETGGRTPVVVGVGALRTDEAVRLAQDAKALGASAGLLAAVSYTPPHRRCLRIVKAARAGDVADARRFDAALTPIWDLFKQFSSLRSVYAFADLLGVCQAEPPRPILSLPEPAKRKVADCLSLFRQDLAE
ncbi:dihydrodipicolinate synthase family protein [Phyllobacterium sophorae]|uniref:Dihydrodipicolinate synthase family protein n=1 Tax=Phyllobacterium sophorae TaxID=1520277 RepID=A0A2P7B6J8_9HYPH|nr:dihydrodipicolinate synthase family protein [Phyllobacterium sophorae]PSH62094.1 hypothetical protein CU103_19775 [Phyllobacterium sophorae]